MVKSLSTCSIEDVTRGILEARSTIPTEEMAAALAHASAAADKLHAVAVDSHALQEVLAPLEQATSHAVHTGTHLANSALQLELYMQDIGAGNGDTPATAQSPVHSSSSAERLVGNAYGGVTDPARHNRSRFRYLVHGINPFAVLNSQLAKKTGLEQGVMYDPAWGDQSISAYEEPEHIGDRVSLSMSLIDQDHTDTWGCGGLIIAAPPENIVLTSPSDAGVDNHNRPQLLAMRQANPPMDGDKLLSKTDQAYNEVVALGEYEGQRLQTIGFFIKVTEQCQPYDSALAERLRREASRLSLPIVSIIQPSMFKKQSAERTNTLASIHVDNWRFNMSFGENPCVTALNETGHVVFPKPSRIRHALLAARSAGILSDEEMKLIAEGYRASIDERRTPKPVYDDGKLIRLDCIVGYEENERTLIVARDSAVSFNLRAEIQAAQYALQGRRHTSSRRPLGVTITDAIVDRACAALDNETAQKVRAWYGNNRARLAQNFANRQEHDDMYVTSYKPPYPKDDMTEVVEYLKVYMFGYNSEESSDPADHLNTPLPDVL